MWPNPQKTANLVTFTEEILNEKLLFLCSVYSLFALAYGSEKNVTRNIEKLEYLNLKKFCVSFFLWTSYMYCTYLALYRFKMFVPWKFISNFHWSTLINLTISFVMLKNNQTNWSFFNIMNQRANQLQGV